ncbi:ribosome hibernation-promoting factor, HPF/YfiA family [Demequina aurantiaca]|uniref:ribosome hibernation-promoting factor, HPF/YfiA family n=1 Tax=Demequina aurantiaca TaxID=676200 RepID=UPI00078465C2|nr:ribosome-associated translation inhibitor RaiA [Demequina aurantiaca]
MDIAIVGRHTKVSEDVRQKILDKLDKVETLAPRATRAEVHVVHERNPRLSSDRERIEITLYDHGVVRVEAAADDRLVALDAAVTRLTERLRRQHERKAHRHNNTPPLSAVPIADIEATLDMPAKETEDEEKVASVESWEGAPEGNTREVPIDGTPIVIRSKTHEGAPMSVADAIDQMELVGHDFFLFHDIESGLASAVYRRRGWTYGVIHLESTAAEPTPIERDNVEAGQRESA